MLLNAIFLFLLGQAVILYLILRHFVKIPEYIKTFKPIILTALLWIIFAYFDLMQMKQGVHNPNNIEAFWTWNWMLWVTIGTIISLLLSGIYCVIFWTTFQISNLLATHDLFYFWLQLEPIPQSMPWMLPHCDTDIKLYTNMILVLSLMATLMLIKFKRTKLLQSLSLKRLRVRGKGIEQ